MLQNHHASACHPGVGGHLGRLMNCGRLTSTCNLVLFALCTHSQKAHLLATVLGKVCYVRHISKNKLNFFFLAYNRLGRITNSLKKEVIQPSKLTFRERAKQVSTCHFPDRTE